MKLSILNENYGHYATPTNPNHTQQDSTIEITYWHDGDKRFNTEKFLTGNKGMAIRRMKTLTDQGYKIRPELIHRNGTRQPIRL